MRYYHYNDPHRTLAEKFQQEANTTFPPELTAMVDNLEAELLRYRWRYGGENARKVSSFTLTGVASTVQRIISSC